MEEKAYIIIYVDGFDETIFIVKQTKKQALDFVLHSFNEMYEIKKVLILTEKGETTNLKLWMDGFYVDLREE